MNPRLLWTSGSFHAPQQNHYILVPTYHKTYHLWTVRYESYDINRKQTFNVTFRKTILSIAPYQDSSIACVLYNLFVYLVLVILVLAAMAITVLILLCAVTIYGLLVAVRQNWSKIIPANRKITKIKNRLNRVNPLDLLTNNNFIYAKNIIFSCLPYIWTNQPCSIELWSFGIHFYLDLSLGVFSRYESIRTSSMEHWRSSNSSIAATNMCISAFFNEFF